MLYVSALKEKAFMLQRAWFMITSLLLFVKIYHGSIKIASSTFNFTGQNGLQDVVSRHPPSCDVQWLEAEEPSFMLYTSGSTGKPKGVLHTVGGYMVYAATTYKYCFAPRSTDVHWYLFRCCFVF